MGQFCSLQDFVSFGNPRHLPPSLSIINLDLDLVCFPLPQLLEHLVKLFHGPHLQFTGQFCTLQDFVSYGDPRHLPPFVSVIDLDLDLVCVPLPQLLEHVE